MSYLKILDSRAIVVVCNTGIDIQKINHKLVDVAVDLSDVTH